MTTIIEEIKSVREERKAMTSDHFTKLFNDGRNFLDEEKKKKLYKWDNKTMPKKYLKSLKWLKTTIC